MLVLASMSPRRREILRMAGYDFIVRPADIDESVPKGTPVDRAVIMTAKRKAIVVAEAFGDEDVVIAADTVVSLDGDIIGKPHDNADAFAILSRLSGRTHTVYTGYCVIKGSKTVCGVEETKVTFRELDDREINAYIASGEPMDKAGAYGLQGRACSFAARLEGDYFNVIGLPISKLHVILKNI